MPDDLTLCEPVGVLRCASDIEDIRIIGQVGVDMQVAIVGVAISAVARQSRGGQRTIRGRRAGGDRRGFRL